MFKNLKKLEVRADKTVEYVMYQLEDEPVLHVAPATEANKPYFNALLKRSRRNQRRLASGNLTAAVIAENRDNDRVLYPQFVVRGWDKVTDGGNPVEATQENVTAFLAAIPDYIFDDVRNFASDVMNFVDSEVDAEDTAKN